MVLVWFVLYRSLQFISYHILMHSLFLTLLTITYGDRFKSVPARMIFIVNLISWYIDVQIILSPKSKRWYIDFIVREITFVWNFEEFLWNLKRNLLPIHNILYKVHILGSSEIWSRQRFIPQTRFSTMSCKCNLIKLLCYRITNNNYTISLLAWICVIK